MKHFTLLLVWVLTFNNVVVAQAAQTQEASQAVKADIQKRGIGEKSRLKVRRRNKPEVRGYISKIEDTSFEVTDKKTGQVTTIPYADVEKLQGAGLSKGAKIGLIAGLGVAIVALVIVAGLKSSGY